MKLASIAAMMLWSALAWADAPNLYKLGADKIKITYSTTGIDGKPHFTYQDGELTQNFAGADIRVVESDAGKLVSVTIHKTVDSGSTTFTLLLPRVNLVKGTLSAPVRTSGIIAMHRFSPVAAMNRGQLDEYNVLELKGEAQSVKF